MIVRISLRIVRHHLLASRRLTLRDKRVNDLVGHFAIPTLIVIRQLCRAKVIHIPIFLIIFAVLHLLYVQMLAHYIALTNTLHTGEHVDALLRLVYLLYLLVELLVVFLSHSAAVAASEAEVVETASCRAHLILLLASCHLLANVRLALALALAPGRLDERISEMLQVLDLVKGTGFRAISVVAEAGKRAVFGAAQLDHLRLAAGENAIGLVRMRPHVQEILSVACRAFSGLRPPVGIAGVGSEAGGAEWLMLSQEVVGSLMAAAAVWGVSNYHCSALRQFRLRPVSNVNGEVSARLRLIHVKFLIRLHLHQILHRNNSHAILRRQLRVEIGQIRDRIVMIDIGVEIELNGVVKVDDFGDHRWVLEAGRLLIAHFGVNVLAALVDQGRGSVRIIDLKLRYLLVVVRVRGRVDLFNAPLRRLVLSVSVIAS